jgi:uncharacterized protein (TIGR03435 family)
MRDASQTMPSVILSRTFALVVALIAAFAQAQSSQAPAPNVPATQARDQSSPVVEFDVAAIKPSSGTEMMELQVNPGGRIRIERYSLKALVAIAFNLGYWQISGGEGWMDKNEFDLEAKPSENLRAQFTDTRHSLFTIDDPRLRAMLQTLLIDRFQFRFHREDRTGDVYLLEKSGKPIKLSPAKDRSTGDNAIMAPGYWEVGYVDGQFKIFNTSMPQFAQFASRMVLRRPVVDCTGLTGSYDYFSPVHREQSDFENSFMELIPELGLKLVRSRGPVETLIIDHAEMPSPN